MTNVARTRVDVDDAAAPVEGNPRFERAIAVFGTWMITGLFLDGWAHEAEKPETFFSPWHGILYSGFVAAVVWSMWDGWRSGRGATADNGLDRLMTVGVVIFVAGAIGDGAWHEIFGVEADLEALVSPSHLALFFGGLLMVATPIRLALRRRDEAGAPTPMEWRDWFAPGVTLVLSTALIGFFTQYLSPFEGVGVARAPLDALREREEVVGVASVLVFNALFVVALLFAVRRWQTPRGFATLLFGAVALGMAGLEGFALVELALPAILAGVVADVLLARQWRAGAVVTVASLVLWCGFFAIADVSYGLAWTVELWSGTIVLAGASSLLLSVLLPEPVARR